MQKVGKFCTGPSFSYLQFHSRYQPAFTRTSNWTENPSTGISEEYMLAVEIQDAACMEDQALAFPRLQARSRYGRFNTAILPEIHFLSLWAWMPKKDCCLLCWHVAAFCEDFTMPLIPHHPSKNWTYLTNSHEQSFGPHLFLISHVHVPEHMMVNYICCTKRNKLQIQSHFTG